MRNKRVIVIVTTLLFASAFIMDGFAQDVSDKQSKLNQIRQQINSVKDRILDSAKEEESISSQIASVNKEIEQIESEIEDIDIKIDEKEGQIEETKEELQKAEKNISKKNDVLGDRLNVMYKNGNVSYVEVLLESKDFTDLMSRLDMVKRIIESDMELLQYMKEQKDQIENNKKLLESQQSNLVFLANSIERKHDELVVSRGKMDRLKKKIMADKKLLEEQEDELLRYANEISEEIRAMQTDAVYEGGKFTWPAPGYKRITSEFGYRIHPVYKTKKFHAGLDIAVPHGKNIVAAEAGTVIFSGWKGGYGNTVMVDHGSGIVTMYPHSSKLVVNKGDKVKRGQVVAKAGSTGVSTGSHLHFEVRKNGKYVNPRPWLGI